mgnify:CR=1 FL=1
MSKHVNIITDLLEHVESGNRIARIELGNETYEYNVKQNISFEEMHQFVESALKLCFDAETNEYLPEYQNFAFNACLVIYFTDLEIPSVQKLYEALIFTDIVEKITSIVNQTQISQLTFGLNTKIFQIIDQKQIDDSSLGKVGNSLNGVIESGQMLLDTMNEGIIKIIDKIDNSSVDELSKSLLRFIAPDTVKNHVSETAEVQKNMSKQLGSGIKTKDKNKTNK